MGNGCMSRRSFVLGAAALGVVGTLGLSGCGAEPEETYAVGDTVESELVRLTLNDAQMAVALENNLSGVDYYVAFFCPKEYDEQEDEHNVYVAALGETLVWFEALIENLDRDHLELGSYSGFISASYDGTTYDAESFVDERYCLVTSDVDGEPSNVTATHLSVQLDTVGKDLYRGYVQAPFEPESLDDPFSITFSLPNSDDTFESFTFEVNG